ncbi:hypothetical protein PGT21_006153 [Puccinia graminis f. sp. tritici]|uniref:Uncharacterized protein n=1 Tax=Puccinia graminis f. sp. tritici TaxID=56615 RepID=A0A5B0Q4T7_PUCGR|nr:hypothetical protein PGT21_006153 [Puccinia graminis f. sp. tritici]
MRISGCFFRPSEHPNPHPHPLAGIRRPQRVSERVSSDTCPLKGRLEGLPSSRQGTCTSLTGRDSFQPAISPSGRGYPLGYPDTRQLFAEKGPSAPKSAPVGGYPLALAGIRQRITGIRDGYPLTISICLPSYSIHTLVTTSETSLPYSFGMIGG